MPSEIKYLIKDAEKADLEESFSYYDYIDAIDVTAKNACAEGLLSKEQWIALVTKYRG